MLLSLEAAYNEKLWMPHSGGQSLLTGKHCATMYGQKDYEIVILDRCSGFCMIAIAEDEVSLFSCSGSCLYVFYNAAEKRVLAKAPQM